MKKEKYSRVKKMIESDRFGMVGGSKELIISDIKALLEEYFTLSSPVKLEIEGDEREFTLTVICEGARVKRFNMLK